MTFDVSEEKKEELKLCFCLPFFSLCSFSLYLSLFGLSLLVWDSKSGWVYVCERGWVDFCGLVRVGERVSVWTSMWQCVQVCRCLSVLVFVFVCASVFVSVCVWVFVLAHCMSMHLRVYYRMFECIWDCVSLSLIIWGENACMFIFVYPSFTHIFSFSVFL